MVVGFHHYERNKEEETFSVQERIDILAQVGAKRKHMLHRLPGYELQSQN
jgi:hypothetical protein